MLVGAGASLDYGAPSTRTLTRQIRNAVLSDHWMRLSGGGEAYAEISATLADYYHGGEDAVNFEQIYHCAHELIYARPPSAGAVDTFRPALSPFVAAKVDLGERALVSLIGFMEDTIFETMTSASARPTASLVPLARFIANIRADWVTRIYTTNYDDFILQSSPDLFTGFPEGGARQPRRFDGRCFWAGERRDCVFHLHGGVHMGFHNGDANSRIGDLFWYDDREEAQLNASYMGSGHRRLDGSQVHRSAIVTGLDKLSRLQNAPMSYYYTSFARDALAADVIYIVGYGLGDVHLNNWLHQARAGSPRPPLVFIDYWREGFARSSAFNENDHRLLEMWHELRMPLGYQPGQDDHSHDGWTLDGGATCAVWDRGLRAFLEDPDRHAPVLARLGVKP
ncbi:SIR2 family protein [Sphingomonas silueang]|uniref:SIR2 family protein n=1 Tax=Sphingomonas silueang TaxID=3156617 RepID=UPI0032B575FF